VSRKTYKKEDRKGLTMNQVIQKTGVTRATVLYYLSLGLLPRPKKTARNMAYYPEETVERIKLIQELKDTRHLPLQKIKALFSERGVEGVKELVQSTVELDRFLHQWMGKSRNGYTLQEIREKSGLDDTNIQKLLEMNLLKRVKNRFDEVSMDLAVAVGKMRNAGIHEGLGFSVEDLRLYVEGMKPLIRREISEFNRRVFGKLPRKKAEEILTTALEGAEMLWIAIRRRILLDYLEERGKETKC